MDEGVYTKEGGDSNTGFWSGGRPSGSEGRHNSNARSYNLGAYKNRSGSDSGSWRKSSESEPTRLKGKDEVGEEVTSPLKEAARGGDGGNEKQIRIVGRA